MVGGLQDIEPIERPFVDRSEQPDDASLGAVLGRSKAHWDAILAHVESTYEGVMPEWKYYGKAHGWQLKLVRGRRAFAYLIPHHGMFVAGLALSPAEVSRLDERRVPPELVEEIRSAKARPEGRPARFEVRTKANLETLRRLLTVRDARTHG